jgi:hypothetical protein
VPLCFACLIQRHNYVTLPGIASKRKNVFSFVSDIKLKVKLIYLLLLTFINNLIETELIKISFLEYDSLQEREYLAQPFGKCGNYFRTDLVFLPHINGAQLTKAFTS